MKCHIIDLDQRNVREELKEYTFEQAKDFFKPSDESAADSPELLEKWESIGLPVWLYLKQVFLIKYIRNKQ